MNIQSFITILFSVLMSMMGVKTLVHDIAIFYSNGVILKLNKLSLLFILSLLPIATNAQNKRSIYVSKAGTLPNLISNIERTSIIELTLGGELNGTDIAYIRRLAGAHVNFLNSGVYTEMEEGYELGNLAVLDISDATILSGGDYYYCQWIDDPEPWSGYKILDKATTSNNTISESMFSGCNLRTIILPDNVTTIAAGAFGGCKSLTEIDIPQSVLSIGSGAFYGCNALTSINIPNTVTSIGNGAFNETAWYNNQPDGIIYVGNVAYSFKGKMQDTNLIIKEGTLGIADGAFSDIRLTSIVIPPSVNSIGSGAFNNCEELNFVVSEINNPFDIYNVFGSIPSNTQLYVPIDTQEKYQEKEGWKAFKSIKEIIDGDVNLDDKVNNTDVIALVAFIMDEEPKDVKKYIADVNKDGKVNVADVTALIEMSTDWGSRTFTVNGASFKMILVEGGTFTMGEIPEQDGYVDSNSTPHNVTLSTYFMAETEVTLELWYAVMGSKPSFIMSWQQPAETEKWDDCQEFITKLNTLTGENFRLPTEAEWEFAARGGNKSRGYKYAGSNTIGKVAWYASNMNYICDVAHKKPNELGIYDMSGNVWEWCQDWYGSYSSSSQTNPTGPENGVKHVCRGGGGGSEESECLVSRRAYGYSNLNYDWFGFRLALSSTTTSTPINGE